MTKISKEASGHGLGISLCYYSFYKIQEEVNDWQPKFIIFYDSFLTFSVSSCLVIYLSNMG